MGDNTCICMGILMWMSDKDDIHILEHRGVCMAFMHLYHIIFIHPYETLVCLYELLFIAFIL